MINYVIPFWTMVSIILVVFGVLTWLSVLKSKDNNAIKTGYEALHYVVEQYLARSFQNTVYILLRYQETKGVKGMDVRLQMYNEKWKSQYLDPVSKNILHFVRGQDICNALVLQNRLPSFDQTNICILPDVIIQRAGPLHYYALLNFASKVIFNTDTTFEKYTNDESKEYLIALVDQYKTKKDN